MERRRRWPWVVGLLLVIVIGVLAYGATASPRVEASQGSESTVSSADLPTVTIQPADLAQIAVSASGNLALESEHSVALETSGVVAELRVQVGDVVAAGDTLLWLDTTDLERTLEQEELNVESTRLALDDVRTPATDAEIAQAEASVLDAQQALDDLLAGSSSIEVAAAGSSLTAAQSSYDELLEGPGQDELTQLSANLRKAEIALQEAQGNYDRVAWQGSASAEAAALQSATIDYEAAKAAYGQSVEPASDSAVQTALSSIQNAQAKLTDLTDSASAEEIASAQAKVAAAQATLDDLNDGAATADIRSKEIALQQALINLESAGRQLDAATVIAPISGVVVSLNAEQGVRSNDGEIVVTLADPTQLELEISVAETDIPNVSLGQISEIEIDALPGKTFSGVVTGIAPTNDLSSATVNYPVTIALTDDDLANVKQGMNAVATLVNNRELPANSWLVPSNALAEVGGSTSVTVIRNGTPATVEVTPGSVQGEWTVVQADGLREGEQVVGSLTTETDDESDGGMMGGAPPPGFGGP